MNDNRDLIVVDTETTGLDVFFHWPLEVAAINLTTGDELYFVPALPVGALDQAAGDALRINGYFERAVYKQQLPPAESSNRWDQLWDMLRGNTLAGANPAFDALMLQRGHAWSRGTYPQQPDKIQFTPACWHHRLADLEAYAAGALHLPPNKLAGLSAICKSTGIERTATHAALDDARDTATAFQVLIEHYLHPAQKTGKP